MKRLLIAAVIVVCLVVAGVAVWVAFIREPAPAAFELSETAASGEVLALDGTWRVVHGSEAGYRVVEDLGEILDFEAVGRTEQVTGTMVISGSTVTAASFEVDIASITSDDGRRDDQFRGPIMDAEQFPTATFALTEAVVLGAVPAEGVAVQATATGELTLRGATNVVTFPIEAQLVGSRIELVGSIDVQFSDYGIENPSNPFVEVRDVGTVEVLLLLASGGP